MSAQFLHLPAGQRQDVYAGLAAAVAPGGRLLIVGHHPSDLHTTAHRVHLPEMMFTADELAAGLDASRWEILAAGSRPRLATGADGKQITVRDTVLVARRRPW